MNPWTFTVLLLCLAIPSLGGAQHWEGGILSSATGPTEKGVSIHLMPLSLANEPSRLRLGGQYKSGRFGYLLDLGYGTRKLRVTFNGNAQDEAYRFFGFRPELRYHLGEKNNGFYAGLELPLTMKFETHRGNLVAEDGRAYHVNTALERRLRFSAILKIGKELIAFRHFFIDAYIGGGGAYRNLRFSDLVDPGPPTEQTMEWGCCELKEHGGDLRAELALGIRLGYWFPVQQP